MRAMALGLVALALAGSASDEKPTGLAVGDKVRLHASGDGSIPAVESEADYVGMLRALRMGQYPTPYLKDVTVPGRLVEIRELKYDRRNYALAAPVARVVIAEGTNRGDVLWVAQQYLRPQGTPTPKGEARLPDFLMVPVPGFAAKIGDVCNLYAVDRKAIPIGTTLEAFRTIQAALTSDSPPRVIEGRGIVQGEIYDQIEIIEVLPFKAVHGRLLDGTHAGEFVYVPTRHVARLEVKISYPKAKGRAKRSRR